MALVENMGAFFADFGGTVSVAGVSATGMFDTASEIALGEAVVVAPSLLVVNTVAASPGDAVVVQGASYKVRQVLDEPPDGVLRRLVLAAV